MLVYLDTSALAKWYLNESRSDEFEEYLRATDEPTVSTLVLVEMRCMLARRRRSGEIDERVESRIALQVEDDVAAGYLLMRPVGDEHLLAARRLIERLEPLALRTLDAIHLAIALQIGAAEMATADRVMAAAATELGIRVSRFD